MLVRWTVNWGRMLRLLKCLTCEKKKNGKTAREGHERLKVGNSEAINCYYARGEKNSCIQRRSYWMLDP
ncbi:hypothetical protein BHM03_00053058 [Ensete ventricosum]|uniref:CG-1 domain-containing protein n=1 Tax=Ensete ventricosum TaxID=4639 RepID=A0A426XNM1_ENSVE|nr:hypothetical protein B296_00058121 [Ensete ventricosum]RZS20529.1 hypothetical protein BHM03_00053058 [Ensete ventricosum]